MPPYLVPDRVSLGFVLATGPVAVASHSRRRALLGAAVKPGLSHFLYFLYMRLPQGPWAHLLAPPLLVVPVVLTQRLWGHGLVRWSFRTAGKEEAYKSRQPILSVTITCPNASGPGLLDSPPSRCVCFWPAADGTRPGHMEHETRARDAWDSMHVRRIRACTESIECWA